MSKENFPKTPIILYLNCKCPIIKFHQNLQETIIKSINAVYKQLNKIQYDKNFQYSCKKLRWIRETNLAKIIFKQVNIIPVKIFFQILQQTENKYYSEQEKQEILEVLEKEKIAKVISIKNIQFLKKL